MENYIDLPRENDVSGDVVYNSYKGAGVALLYFDGKDYTNLEYVPLREDTSILVTSPIQKMIKQAQKNEGHKVLLGTCSCFQFCLPTELVFSEKATRQNMEDKIDGLCRVSNFTLFQ